MRRLTRRAALRPRAVPPSAYGVATALLLVAFAFVPGIAGQGVDLSALHDRPLDALGVGLVLAQALPVAALRRWPGVGLAVTGAAFAAYQLLHYPTTVAALGLLVSLYGAGLGLHRHRRAVAATAVVAYALLAVALHVAGSPERLVDYASFTLVLAACWALGGFVRWRAVATAAERERAEREAVVAERSRIARDLHDVITHHVTAMVVQADAATFRTSDPAAVEQHLAAISAAGRRALTDLRAMLDALQGEPDDERCAPRQPTAGSIAELVAGVTAAGQPVELVEEGEPAPLGADAAEVAAYRVVQESLTNALRHAAGAHTTVRLRHAPAWLDVEVTTARAARADRSSRGGRGLVGLRARVAAAGGRLDAHPTGEGGFTVTARIPRATP